jgi:polysaccharide biosynthesis protein PslH
MPSSAPSESPLVVIVGPPWLRTGTGRVIEDQIAYYRDRGFATAFVGVPVGSEQGPEHPMWLRKADAARELHADHVSFAILDAPQDPMTPSRRLRQLLAPRTSLDWIVEVGYHSHPSQALLDYLRNNEIALLHVNHVFTLGFMRRLRAELGLSGRKLPVLLETHDVQSGILHDRQELNPWTGRPDSLQRLRRAELAHLMEADLLVHCSVDDQRFFIEKFPDKPHVLVRPSIHGSFVEAVKAALELSPIDILLVGTEHHGNLEAVEWFLMEVWPLIAENGYTVRIVGEIRDLVQVKRPVLHDQFRKLFVGRVADLAPYYRAARSVIAPMRSGGGISIKTIEAFALAVPFVGTAKAFRGFPIEPLIRNGIHSHDDPQAFAGALLRILSGNDDDTGKRGRAVYDELFDEDKCYAARDEAVRIAREIAASKSPRNRSSFRAL